MSRWSFQPKDTAIRAVAIHEVSECEALVGENRPAKHAEGQEEQTKCIVCTILACYCYYNRCFVITEKFRLLNRLSSHKHNGMIAISRTISEVVTTTHNFYSQYRNDCRPPEATQGTLLHGTHGLVHGHESIFQDWSAGHYNICIHIHKVQLI